MFKGIVAGIGTITNVIEKPNSDKRFCIATQNLSSIKLGDSIACSGVCLTVVDIVENSIFTVEVSEATLAVTNLIHWYIGKKINLEQAMRLNDRIDGHLVQGHVDDIAIILAIEEKLNSREIKVFCSQELTGFIVKKGSIALDGVSLTVNSTVEQEFSVNIIPYTWENTTLKYNNINDKVNLEIDLVARYLKSNIMNK